MATVLILDDREDNLLTMQAILSGSYNVIIESNPNNLFTQLSEHEPDLLVLDLRLPGIDGLELAQSVRQHIPATTMPIIAVTAVPENYTRDEVYAAGCDSFMRKPFDVKTFREEVKRLLYG